MRRNNRLLPIIVALIVFSLACRPLIGTPEPTPMPTRVEENPTAVPVVEPAATTAPTSTPKSAQPAPTATSESAQPAPTTAPPKSTPRPKGGGLEIINDTDKDIWYLYLSSTDSQEWGDDQLGGDIIPAGTSYILTGIPNGEYDVQARDADDNTIQTAWALQITSDAVWRVTAQSALEITNASDTQIAYLYVSPVDNDTWGEDVLGANVIPSFESYLIEDIEPGAYDVRAEDIDENLIEVIYNIYLDGDYYWNVVGMSDLAPNAVLRFEDDFTTNRNNWGLTSPSGAIFSPPSDGEFCIEVVDTNMTAWEWYEPFRTDQFIAEVNCIAESNTDASCGLGFGPDANNLYWFEVSPNDQTFALFLLLDGEWQSSLISWTTSKNITPQGWNYLSLERVNGVVSVFINGVLQGEVSSDHFPTGRIGLGGSTYDQANVSICMDDLRVWRME